MEKNKKCIVISFADSNKKGKLLKFEDIVKFFKKRYEFGDIFMISSYNNWFGVYYHIIIDCMVDNSLLKKFIGKYKVSSIKIEEKNFDKYYYLARLLGNVSYLHWYNNSKSELVLLENGFYSLNKYYSLLVLFENWLEVEKSEFFQHIIIVDNYIIRMLYKIVEDSYKIK